MLWEKRWSWWGIALCALGGALALIWMAPAQNNPSRDMVFLVKVLRTLLNAGNMMLPISLDGALAGWTIPAHLASTLAAGAMMPILVLAATRSTPLPCAAATSFALLTLALTLAGQSLNLRHFGFIIITIIACQWIAIDKGFAINRLAAIWFVFLAVCGIDAAVMSIREPFAASRMMADHVAETIEEDRLIIPVDTVLGVEVTAFTGRLSYNVSNKCMQTFVQWRGPPFMPSGQFVMPINDATEAAAREALEIMKAAAARAGGRALLIFGDDPSFTFHLVADQPFLRFDRFFHVGGPRSLMDRYLYRLDVPADPNPVPIPPCMR